MQPFSSIRVLDLTHVLAGPYATYMLALLGAEVIKIEGPDAIDCARGRGPSAGMAQDGLGLNYQVQASNKRSIHLDLKAEKGRDVFLRLADSADVVVENFRVGAMEALGLGAAALQARNPALIYCSITGFGQSAAASSYNAYDNVIQAASGIMASTGGAHAPIKTGASVIDYFTGMSAAFALSAALYQRAQTGKGQVIDCAMFDCALATMAPEIAGHLYTGPKRSTPKEAGLGVYQTRDGLLMMGAFNVRQNRRLWSLLKNETFAALDDWQGLWDHADAMRSDLAKRLTEKSAEDWEALFNTHGIPAQRVRSLDDALNEALLERPAFLTTVDETDVTVPLTPFQFAHGGAQVTSAPPAVGQNTTDILAQLGLSETEIKALRTDGIIQ